MTVTQLKNYMAGTDKQNSTAASLRKHKKMNAQNYFASTFYVSL